MCSGQMVELWYVETVWICDEITGGGVIERLC